MEPRSSPEDGKQQAQPGGQVEELLQHQEALLSEGRKLKRYFDHRRMDARDAEARQRPPCKLCPGLGVQRPAPFCDSLFHVGANRVFQPPKTRQQGSQAAKKRHLVLISASSITAESRRTRKAHCRFREAGLCFTATIIRNLKA